MGGSSAGSGSSTGGRAGAGSVSLKSVLARLRGPLAGFEETFRVGEEALASLPQACHGRVHLELAEVAKRYNRFGVAHEQFQM